MKNLCTVEQLAKSQPPEPSLGKWLYKRTSQVVYPHPIRGVSGRKGRMEIHMMRDATCVVRPYKVPHDPKTTVQLARRAAMGEAKGNWHRVPAENRAAWQRYALDHVFPERRKTGRDAALAANVKCARGKARSPAFRACCTDPPSKKSTLWQLLAEMLTSPAHCSFL